MVKLRLRRRRRPNTTISVPRGSIFGGGMRYGRPITREYHPEPSWLRRGGSTEGRSLVDKLRNLGVPVFDEDARMAELHGYTRSGSPGVQPAAEPPASAPEIPTWTPDTDPDRGRYGL